MVNYVSNFVKVMQSKCNEKELYLYTPCICTYNLKPEFQFVVKT